MNYHNITSPDMLNGTGLRTVLWVSGCEHNCPGCHNPQTHAFDSGIKFNQDALDEIIFKSDHNYIEGLTLSGGDPLNPHNVPEVLNIVKEFKIKFPDKNVWACTGFTYEQLIKMSDSDTNYKEILSLIDVLVDGRFVEKLKDSTLHFRGSSNQRIIDMRKSTPNNIILLEV